MAEFVTEFEPTVDTRILDIGGTRTNWDLVDVRSPIVLLNILPPDEAVPLPPNLSHLQGDGCDLEFADHEFDICFSNSTIEHLHTFEAQERFAREVRRVGRSYYVQTPARSFPFEPHWLGLFVHWLPRSWQRKLVRNTTLYGLAVRPSAELVEALLDEYRLLTAREMHELFPDADLRRERFLGLTKSFLAVRHDHPQVTAPAARQECSAS